MYQHTLILIARYQLWNLRNVPKLDRRALLNYLLLIQGGAIYIQHVRLPAIISKTTAIESHSGNARRYADVSVNVGATNAAAHSKAHAHGLLLVLELLHVVLLFLQAVLFFAFEFEIFDLVLHESWKAELAPVRTLFAAGALYLLPLMNIHDIVWILRQIVGRAEISVYFVYTDFAENFGAIVAHFGGEPNDAEAHGAD